MRIPLIAGRVRMKGEEEVSAGVSYDTKKNGVTFSVRGMGDWERPSFWKRLLKRITDLRR